MHQNKRVPIMPIATALWLIDNTSLTFKQIADFCGIHELEVETIANGESAQGIRPINPVISGQLTYDEIKRCSQSPTAMLNLQPDDVYLISKKSKKRFAKYTPIARRQDKPDAIYWLLKNYPDIQDSQIIKLIGTTKATIHAIREKTHWNMKNIRARDPVLLGICNQVELDNITQSLGSTGVVANKEQVLS